MARLCCATLPHCMTCKLTPSQRAALCRGSEAAPAVHGSACSRPVCTPHPPPGSLHLGANALPAWSSQLAQAAAARPWSPQDTQQPPWQDHACSLASHLADRAPHPNLPALTNPSNTNHKCVPEQCKPLPPTTPLPVVSLSATSVYVCPCYSPARLPICISLLALCKLPACQLAKEATVRCTPDPQHSAARRYRNGTKSCNGRAATGQLG